MKDKEKKKHQKKKPLKRPVKKSRGTRGELDLQDVLQGRAKVLAHTQGHKVADSSSSPSGDFSYKDKFLDAGPGSCKRLLNQDLMEKENFSSMAHSHLPSSLANNPLESATSTETKRVLNVYYQPVPMKRGTACLGDTEDDLEPPAKMTRIARITFSEKIPSKASLSSVCLRDVLTVKMACTGKAKRKGKRLRIWPRIRCWRDLYSGFRCMGCNQVFPNMRMLKKHLEDGVDSGASCLSLAFAKLRNKMKQSKRITEGEDGTMTTSGGDMETLLTFLLLVAFCFFFYYYNK